MPLILQPGSVKTTSMDPSFTFTVPLWTRSPQITSRLGVSLRDTSSQSHIGGVSSSPSTTTSPKSSIALHSETDSNSTLPSAPSNPIRLSSSLTQGSTTRSLMQPASSRSLMIVTPTVSVTVTKHMAVLESETTSDNPVTVITTNIVSTTPPTSKPPVDPLPAPTQSPHKIISTVIPTTTSSTLLPSHISRGLGIPSVIGIALGALLLLLLGAGVFWWRHKQRRDMRSQLTRIHPIDLFR